PTLTPTLPSTSITSTATSSTSLSPFVIVSTIIDNGHTTVTSITVFVPPTEIIDFPRLCSGDGAADNVQSTVFYVGMITSAVVARIACIVAVTAIVLYRRLLHARKLEQKHMAEFQRSIQEGGHPPVAGIMITGAEDSGGGEREAATGLGGVPATATTFR